MKTTLTKRKSRLTAIERREAKVGYIMLAPAVCCLSLFVIVPLGMAVYNSFHNWNFYRDGDFVGLKYYIMVLKSPIYHQAYKNVFKYMIFVPLGIAVNFSFALLLRSLNDRFVKIVKVVTYIPGMTAGIVTGTLFAFMFNYNGGIVNQFIQALGFDRIAFDAHPGTAMALIQIPSFWLGLGSGMIMNYAGLMGIPMEYYEAASIDGANAFYRFIHITIPQMKNIFFLQAIGGITGCLMIFELPYSLTGGGPLSSTMSPALQLFYHYRSTNFPKSAVLAASLILMVIIAMINAVIFKFFNSEKSLEG